MNIDMSAYTCNQKTTKVVLRTNSKTLPYKKGTINQKGAPSTKIGGGGVIPPTPPVAPDLHAVINLGYENLWNSSKKAPSLYDTVTKAI